MKRREILKYGLLATAGTLIGCNQEELSPSVQRNTNIKVLPTNPEQNYENQVIIIGAGISGLAAAQRLAKQNIKVLILEGQSRIGGRIWTDRSLGFPFDMGAGWIHGPSAANPVTKLAADVNAKTYLTDDSSFSLFDRMGREVSDAAFNAANQNYKNLRQQLTNFGRSATTDIPVIEALEKIRAGALAEPYIQWMMSSYLEFDKGGPIDTMSVRNFDSDEKFEGKDVLFPDGYDQIFKNFTDLQPFTKLSHLVTEIEYNANGVKVTTDKGVFTGKNCVCTLPLGVLKKGNVKFTPELPDIKKESINRMLMGGVNKVVLVFDAPFWQPLKQQYFGFDGAVKGKYGYFLNLRTFTDINCLVTFGFGTFGYEIDKQTDTQIRDEAMVSLRAMFGATVPNPTKILVTRWGNDPFAYGAYSFGNLNSTYDDFINMGATVENKIFFAGEHTHPMYRATVHGAYLSGLREADKILALL